MDAYKVRISPEHVALIRSKGVGLDRGLFLLLNELLQYQGADAVKITPKSSYDNLTPAEEAQRRANYQAGREKAKETRRNRDIGGRRVYLGGQLVIQSADLAKEKT